MRKGLLAAWLVMPIGAWAYHEGPGQDRLDLDRVGALLRTAEREVGAEAWLLAVEAYDAALEKLPGDRLQEARRIRLERDKARMLCSKLPEAHADLLQLVDELAADPGADADLLDDARRTQASAQYYMTWLMRLEGQPRERWEPEIEAARQTYRLLAERAEASGDQRLAKQSKEDLEAAIKLGRLELQDLQGLPLPSQ